MRLIIKAIASGFGTGYSPFASGTAGSLLAAVIYWFIIPHNYITLGLVLFITLAISIPLSSAAEKIYGKKDHSHIVIDEIVGFWVSVIFLPYSIKITVLAFFLFRIFDVIKPLYIRKSQNLPGGWGVVLDDVFAGILTNLILQLLKLLKMV